MEAERNKVHGHGQRHGHGCLVKHIASRWDAYNKLFGGKTWRQNFASSALFSYSNMVKNWNS